MENPLVGRCGWVGRVATAAAAAVCWAGAQSLADTIRVVVTGTVESNGIRTGLLAPVRAGAPVTYAFNVDSGVFLNSPNLPGRTRGYTIQNGTFVFQIGTINVPLAGNPTVYFVIRNNDPVSDGFFTGLGTDIETPVPLSIGLAGYGVRFTRTFNGGSTLPSLNILDALGTWGFNDLSVYGFDVELNENVTPLIIGYETITLSNVTPQPCAADFDGDGSLTPEDLSDYVTAYFVEAPGNGSADFDENGQVTPDDLADYVTAYFAGC